MAHSSQELVPVWFDDSFLFPLTYPPYWYLIGFKCFFFHYLKNYIWIQIFWILNKLESYITLMCTDSGDSDIETYCHSARPIVHSSCYHSTSYSFDAKSDRWRLNEPKLNYYCSWAAAAAWVASVASEAGADPIVIEILSPASHNRCWMIINQTKVELAIVKQMSQKPSVYSFGLCP